MYSRLTQPSSAQSKATVSLCKIEAYLCMHGCIGLPLFLTLPFVPEVIQPLSVGYLLLLYSTVIS